MGDVTVTVYTTEPCPYCRMAKALLGKRGIEYDEINLTMDPAGRAELVERTGMLTFPQIIVGDELVGGYTEVVAAANSGRLEQLLAA